MRTLLRTNSLAILALILPTICFPQTDPKPRPAPEVQRVINSLQGTWAITAKLEPSPKMPIGGNGRGIEKWRAGPGNGSAIEDVHLSTPAWDLTLMAISWWDEQAQGIRSLVCQDSTPPACAVETELCQWEGNQLVFQNEWERNGKRYRYKEVWSDITTTSFTQTTYRGEAGSELKLAQTIHARRVSARPNALNGRWRPTWTK